MQIKLLNKEITSNFIEELLRGRGIENPYRFLHPGPDSLQSWRDLDNIEEGVHLIKKMMCNPSASIGLIIDSDADGYTSAAIIHQYLKRIHCDNVTWYFHTGKQHGFEDVWEDMIEAKHDLIICPDAGSNDGKFIQNFDCPVLVLDHHILEEDSVIPPNMILINNQTSQKYKAVQVSYFNPKKKKVVKATARNENVKKGDTLKITARCSDRKQAIAKAQAALSTADTKIEGSLEFTGNPYLIAGSNIELKGVGHFSGKYHIKQARHVIDRASGYKTYCEVESA